jgi:hypothetical protein
MACANTCAKQATGGGAIKEPVADLAKLQLGAKARASFVAQVGGVTHTAPSKYHDEIISLVFIHTKYGEPIVIMVFRRAIKKVLCLTPPPPPGALGPTCVVLCFALAPTLGCAGLERTAAAESCRVARVPRAARGRSF